MNDQLTTIPQRTLDAAYAGTMTFPAIVGDLIAGGFEGYDIDYRRNTATYFHGSGESVQLSMPHSTTSVAVDFDAGRVAHAVREAQTNAPGYTYAGFCEQVKSAGCAGYMVSFLGKRVVYFGRTAETHVEHFPQ